MELLNSDFSLSLFYTTFCERKTLFFGIFVKSQPQFLSVFLRGKKRKVSLGLSATQMFWQVPEPGG